MKEPSATAAIALGVAIGVFIILMFDAHITDKCLDKLEAILSPVSKR